MRLLLLGFKVNLIFEDLYHGPHKPSILHCFLIHSYSICVTVVNNMFVQMIWKWCKKINWVNCYDTHADTQNAHAFVSSLSQNDPLPKNKNVSTTGKLSLDIHKIYVYVVFWNLAALVELEYFFKTVRLVLDSMILRKQLESFCRWT